MPDVHTPNQMELLTVTFAGAVISIGFPAKLAATISELGLAPGPENPGNTPKAITVNGPDDDQLYHIISESSGRVSQSKSSDFSTSLFRAIIAEFFDSITKATPYHGAALFRRNHVVVIPGLSGTAKALLTCHLLACGLKYGTGELVCFDEQEKITGYSSPMVVPNSGLNAIKGYLSKQIKEVIPGEYQSLVHIAPQYCVTSETSVPVSIFLIPVYSPGKKLSLQLCSPAKAALKIVSALHKDLKSSQFGFDTGINLARNVLAIEVEFGAAEQLAELDADIFPFILDNHFDKKALARYLSQVNRCILKNPESKTFQPHEDEEGKPEIPLPTKKGRSKKLTIGMATYDDYDGVYFSVQALRMYHPEVTDETEILVIDNNPSGPCGKPLKNLEHSIQGYRYFPFNEQTGTANSRDRIFREANSEYVMSIDCHVFIVPGAIRRLIDYLEQNDTSANLYQGPLVTDNLTSLCTHFVPQWSGGMYGRWGTDERAKDMNADPFEIEMQGLGLFVCARDAWVGFNPLFRGFGGEEGYIHEKVRQRGGHTLCLPFLRWLHRFERPLGVPYPLNWRDRVYNYLVGFRELGLDCEQIRTHFREFLGEDEADRMLQEIENDI